MVVKSASHQFQSSFSYFRDKIDCVRCNPAIKNPCKFHLCPECKKFFANKGIVGFHVCEDEINDAFKYIIYIEQNQVFKGKILGGGGLGYDPFLKDLDMAWFYNPIQIERDPNDILEEMFLIDYDDHHFLIDIQDYSDEPLF
ncbi:MAG: hypothetical protein ACTSVL_06345 [Promethearchaeota archaeon]